MVWRCNVIAKNGIDFVKWLCSRREMAEQSLRLDGRKVCNIKRVGISQAESNKTTVCVLPSIHLPLTREASLVRGKAVEVLLRWLWGWQYSVQREGQAPRPTKSGWGSSNAKTYKHTQTLALRKASGIVRMQNKQSVHLRASVVVRGKR